MSKSIDINSMLKSRNVAPRTRPKKKKNIILIKSIIRIIFLIMFSLALFSMAYIWSGFKQTQMGYEISELKRKELRLKELNRKLKVEISVLKSPQRLENIAKKIGLKHPKPNQIIILK